MNHLKTLYFYELKKLLKRKMVLITLLLCLFVTGVTILVNLAGSYYVDDKKVDTHYHMFQVDKGYEEALDGRVIDQALLEEMTQAYGMIPMTAERYSTTDEYQKYARPYSAIFNFVRDATWMTITETLEWKPDENELQTKRQALLDSLWKESVLTDNEIAFWQKKETEVQKPFTFAVKEGYCTLFEGFTTIGLFVLLAVAICLSNVFTQEHSRRTDQLILCTTNGKGKAYWAKILAGISFAIGVSLVNTAFAFLLALSVYGPEGFDAAFQLIYARYSYPLTV